jgi:molybdopterin molybdotransferase
MKSIGEALREIVPCFAPVGVVRRGLLDAAGLVLAEDVFARADLPGFDNSAMDGYAVRAADLAPSMAVPLAGESRAGGPPPAALAPGSAMRIFTGAPMPAGADTVVIQENAREEHGHVTFTSIPKPGANVRRRASDLAAASLALARGQQLGAGEIALLAAQDQPSVSVYRPPRVAIVSTGDELRDIGEDAAPGTIVNSNAYALAAQVRALGCEAWMLPAAPDRVDAIAARVREALRADVVLSAGGVSVGKYDLVGAAFEQAGVELKLWKVAMKPGKPQLFGVAGAVPVLGLPGNPVSALVSFEVFVRPALRRMLGHVAPYPALIEVELEHDHRHATGRVELARASLRRGDGGLLLARTHALQGSGSLPSMCGVDALLVLDAEVETFARGCRLRALPLRELANQHEPPFA